MLGKFDVISKITISTFDFDKHLTIRELSHIALCNTGFSFFTIILLAYRLLKYKPGP